MLSTALTDSGIGCFNAKFHFSFWRPVKAIPNAEIDGNPDTEADHAWLPRYDTPHPNFRRPTRGSRRNDRPENFFGTSHVVHSYQPGYPGNPHLPRYRGLERQAFWHASMQVFITAIRSAKGSSWVTVP
jgi:hypothetical protein